MLRRATGFLEQHGSTSPRLDAELLLADSLGLRRIDLYLQFERPMSEAELGPYRELIARRGRGQPVAYLTGRKEFMGLTFEVTPDVLVPNPDTETLVHRAVEICRARGGLLQVADVGTGSGCIAVAVAHFVPEVSVVAIDVDAAALEVARRNVAAHRMAGRIELRQGDLLAGLGSEVDLLCANLPYVAEGTELPAEVAAQPARALFAGPTGAEAILRLLEEAPRHLAPGSALLAEADPLVMPRLVEAATGRYRDVRTVRDLAGRDRVLEAWRT